MGLIKTQGDAAFRDYVTDGVPASGRHNPAKSDIRTLFTTIDGLVNAAQASAPSSPSVGQFWLDTDTPSATLNTLYVYDGTDWIRIGLLDKTNNQWISKSDRPYTSIASASTLDISTAVGDLILVTGTTGITAISNQATGVIFLRFAAALTLTHGANLVLPGATNYTTAAGDVLIFASEGGGTTLWRCIGGMKASGLPLVAAAGTAAAAIPVRQTVLAGPVDSAGLPTFLPATAVSLSITSQNLTAGTPLVVTAANGFDASGAVNRVGARTTNLTWSGLTGSATNYLYVDIDGAGAMTPGSTTLAPVYQPGGTYSVTSGQFTFNIKEMVAKVGNGSVANQTWRVFVGEAVTNVSTVTSTVAYAYAGQYEFTNTSALAPSTSYTRAHAIGTDRVNADLFLICQTTNGGYSVGDVVKGAGNVSTWGLPLSLRITRNSVYYILNANGLYLQDASTGSTSFNLTLSSWRERVIVTRAW